MLKKPIVDNDSRKKKLSRTEYFDLEKIIDQINQNNKDKTTINIPDGSSKSNF